MQLQSYTFHYALDFPTLVKNCSKTCILTEQHGSQMLYKELLQVQAPSVYNQLEFIIRNKDVLPYNYVEGINDLSRNVLQVNLFEIIVLFCFLFNDVFVGRFSYNAWYK